MARSTLEQPATTPLLVDDRFEVLLDELLGEGGISQVFAGRDLVTDRRVAAKRLRPVLATDEEARWRFEREQRVSSVLEHPNVVRFIDATDGWLFLELVDGTNLKHLLAERSVFDLDEAVRIARGTAAGLEHLHQLGIVHLDVKPQNIMMTSRNRVKLIDLGLAHEFADQQVDRLGTAAYITPEQINREPVDARTDVYLLGCVFFEMVTGRPPFVAPGLTGEAEQTFLLDAHRYDEAPPPSTLRGDLPLWVDDVADRALAKSPEHRFANAGAMLAAIDRGQTGHSDVRPARRVDIRPPVVQPREDSEEQEQIPSGPGITSRLFHWMWSVLRAVSLWVLRRQRHMSRRLGVLVGILATVMVLNVPMVSNGLMELAIDTVPWTQAQVASDGLNLRSEASRTSTIVTTLESGSTVSITGLPQEHDGITWWPVAANGETGWVAEADEGETYLEENGLMNAVTMPAEVRDTLGGLFGLLIP